MKYAVSAPFEGSKINEAKVTLAYEVTKLVHGKEEADKAKAAAEALFGAGGDMGNAPVVEVSRAQFGSPLLDLLLMPRSLLPRVRDAA